MLEKPLVKGQFIIEKFSGKGGWTYVKLPDVSPKENAPFGWINVYGSIDDYAIENYHLQSFGQGQMFLPLKAKIRKIIKKEAGDTVKLKLFETVINETHKEEIIACFKLEEHVFNYWNSLTEIEKNKTIDFIVSAKNEADKAERILKFITKINP